MPHPCPSRRGGAEHTPGRASNSRRPREQQPNAEVGASLLMRATDTHHDHTNPGQDKSENGLQWPLGLVSRGVWLCVAQHFQSAAQHNAKLPGRPILRPGGGHFRFIVASVFMVMVCVCTLFISYPYHHPAPQEGSGQGGLRLPHIRPASAPWAGLDPWTEHSCLMEGWGALASLSGPILR